MFSSEIHSAIGEHVGSHLERSSKKSSGRISTCTMDLEEIIDLHRFSSVQDGKWGTLTRQLNNRQEPMDRAHMSIH